MSPIPSVATASTLSSAAPASPSVALGPDSGGQSASVASQHLLGTGGLLFAVVALVSVAAYFYRGRGAANSGRTSNTWAPLSGLLLSMRRRGSAKTSAGAGTDWPVDVEVGFEQHVNMVYARFFHPTFWNVVECHPATPSAPAIFVEDETDVVPVPGPQSPGFNSFLNMDDDGGGDRVDNDKHVREKLDRKEVAPYDTSSPTNMNFSSEIIGTTIRPGAFLSVPREPEDSSECSLSDSEEDFFCSPYDGIATADSDKDFFCSPYDGIVTPKSSSSTRRYGVADIEYLAQSPEHTIPEEGYSLVPTISRRSGLLNLSNFVEDPNLSCGTLDLLGPVDDERTISNRGTGVYDSRADLGNDLSVADTLAAPHDGHDLMRKLLAELRDPGLDCSPRPLSEDNDSEYYGDDEDEDGEANTPCLTFPCSPHNARLKSPESTFTLGTQSDVSDDKPNYSSTDLGCSPRPLSEDSDSEYDDDKGEDEEGCVPCPAPPWSPHNARRNSPESTSTPGTDSDVSDDGPNYPLTPPSQPTVSLASAPRLEAPWSPHNARRHSPESIFTPGTNRDVSHDGPKDPVTPPSKPATSLASVPDVHKNYMLSLVTTRLNREALVMSLASLDSLPSLPAKAHVRSHRVSRSLLHGSWAPMVKLPPT